MSKQEEQVLPRHAGAPFREDPIHPAPGCDIQAGVASSSEDSRLANGHFEGASSPTAGRIEARPKGGHARKPPLYKQSQQSQVQRSPVNSNGDVPFVGSERSAWHLPAVNESSNSDRGVRQPVSSEQHSAHHAAVEVFEAVRAELGEAYDSADPEFSRASSVDFDVTLLPEVTLQPLQAEPRVVQKASKEEAVALPAMRRQESAFIDLYSNRLIL